MIESRLTREALRGPIAVVLSNASGQVSWCNESAAELFGSKSEVLVGRAVQDVLRLGPPNGSFGQQHHFSTLFRMDGTPFLALHFHVRRPSGDAHYLFAASHFGEGAATRIIGADIDTSKEKAAESTQAADSKVRSEGHLAELQAARVAEVSARLAAEANAFRESIWRQAVGAAGYGVWSYTVDHAGEEPRTYVEFCSDEWFSIRGATTDQHELHDYDVWIKRVHPDDVENVLACTARQAKGEERAVSFEFRELHANGHWVWILVRGLATDFDETGRPHRVIGIDMDISAVKEEEARRAREMEATYSRHLAELQEASQLADAARQEAQNLARLDMATGLANRRFFREKILSLIDKNVLFSVFLIDLDRFKSVNDLHGHGAGDHVLVQSANRLKDAIGADGIAARIGGDEFGAILRHDASKDSSRLKAVAANLIASISQPIIHGDLVLHVGASVGSANFPDDGGDYDILLQHADMALYKSKTTARGSLSAYTRLMGQEAEDKAAMEADLRDAICNETIVPWYQPIVSIDGNTEKLEILARWEHRARGFVPPDKFITVAEHIAMIPELTACLLQKACLAALDWPGTKLSLNISAREACDPATPLRVLDCLLRTGFSPSDLEIEVTEQALITDLDSAKQVIAALRSSGMKVYIDDFGEGYAGIGYLRNLVIDGIKFDRSCVKDICSNPQSAKFLQSLQIMAANLGCRTVAEGIETVEVWNKVRSIGCDQGQGYFFARPMPVQNVAHYLAMKSKAAPKVLVFPRP
jgi:diguanylate cyclase (GGDEF)-like protein